MRVAVSVPEGGRRAVVGHLEVVVAVAEHVPDQAVDGGRQLNGWITSASHLELEALHHEVGRDCSAGPGRRTPPVDETVSGTMRLEMVFWNTASVEAAALPVAVAPTSICWLVSGRSPGLPKIVVPIGVVVKLAPSSVAVGARKPLEAPARPAQPVGEGVGRRPPSRSWPGRDWCR